MLKWTERPGRAHYQTFEANEDPRFYASIDHRYSTWTFRIFLRGPVTLEANGYAVDFDDAKAKAEFWLERMKKCCEL